MLKIIKSQIFQCPWRTILLKFHDSHKHSTNITNIILYNYTEIINTVQQPDQNKFSNRVPNKIGQLFIFTRGSKKREEIQNGIFS